jgi:hypothetical protein
VGGSTADRILNCPGSWAAIQALPPTVEVPSIYADEGSFAHAVMDFLLNERKTHPDIDLHAEARGLLGQLFYDKRAVTQEHLDTMILPALDHLETLEEEYGGGFVVAEVEARVRFPGIPNAFGTVDVLLQSKDGVIVMDWKFGSGIPILAVYKTEDGGEVLNSQLSFYAAAALHTLPSIFAKRELAVAIIQPRTDSPLTHTSVSRQELNMFAEDLDAAVSLALDRDPPTKRGAWCRFAPCKVTCPHWTGPLLDLTAIGVVAKIHGDEVHDKVTPYGQYLSNAKSLVDMAVLVKTEIDRQLQAFLEEGGIVPGYRLKLKTKNRAWVAEEIVVPELEKLGFTEQEIWQSKLQTFTSVDATAKRLKVKIPDHLRVAPPTSEVTVCPVDDPSPVVDRREAIQQFGAALKQLQLKKTG